MRDPIVDAVPDVLNERDVDAARARLAAALLDATGADVAARVSIRHHSPAAPAHSGWTLIATCPVTELRLQPLREHAALLRGLDRYLELLDALRSAADRAQTERSAQPAAALTPRELMVLQLMHTSCTATAIGARLGVSPRTVQKHQEHLYRKLGARDRLEAVLLGQRSGLLPLEPEREEPAAAVPAGPQPAQAARPVSRLIESSSKSASER